MYLRGLKGFGQAGDEFLYDEQSYSGYSDLWGGTLSAQEVYGTSTAAATSGPSESMDWTGLFTTAIKTWGGYEQAKLQSETAIQLAPYQQPRTMLTPYTTSPRPTQRLPGYSPFPGTGAGGTFLGLSMTTWLILAAAGTGAFFLLRK